MKNLIILLPVLITMTLNCNQKDCLRQENTCTQCSTNKVELKSISIDETKSIYKIYKYDLNKPIMPSGIISNSNNKIFAYGKTFHSSREYINYERKLKENSNHEIFNVLEDFRQTPENVPIAFDFSDDLLKDKQMNQSVYYPNIILNILNNEKQPIAISSIIISVDDYMHASCILDLTKIISDEKEIILISSQKQSYEYKLLNPINILSGKSENLRFKLLPENYKQKTFANCSILLCKIKICWNNGYLISKYFLLTFYN